MGGREGEGGGGTYVRVYRGGGGGGGEESVVFVEVDVGRCEGLVGSG